MSPISSTFLSLLWVPISSTFLYVNVLKYQCHRIWNYKIKHTKITPTNLFYILFIFYLFIYLFIFFGGEGAPSFFEKSAKGQGMSKVGED